MISSEKQRFHVLYLNLNYTADINDLCIIAILKKEIKKLYQKHKLMDIKIEKKPWYIRYRYYMIAALAFIIFLIYVISLSLGPRKLRIETDNIQIAEVKDDKFMEYVDVEGLVQPILTIKVNTREAGSVDRIVGEEGNMMKQGDTLLILTNPDLIRSIEDQRDEWEKQRITYKRKR